MSDEAAPELPTDIIVISFHPGINFGYDRRRDQYEGEIKAECEIIRVPDIDALVDHLSKIEFRLDAKLDEMGYPRRYAGQDPVWEHRIVWNELFDQAALDASWSERFQDYLPTGTAGDLDTPTRDKLWEAIVLRQKTEAAFKAEQKRLADERARLAAEAAAKAATEATEAKDRAEYNRLRKKYEE